MDEVIICDDNIHFCDLVEALLKKHEQKYEIKTVKFYDGRNLLEYCRNNKFDILILDIDLGEDNGMDIARILKSINSKSLIIYISSYDYYRDMVNAEPFRFVQKDAGKVDEFEMELSDALLAAITRLHEKKEYTFTFSKTTYTIDLCKVKYFCSVGRTIHICGEELGDCPDYFYGKIDDLYENVKGITENFAHVNKRYIVNIKYVEVINNRQILIAGKTLTLTGKYRTDFIKNYYSKI